MVWRISDALAVGDRSRPRSAPIKHIPDAKNAREGLHIVFGTSILVLALILALLTRFAPRSRIFLGAVLISAGAGDGGAGLGRRAADLRRRPWPAGAIQECRGGEFAGRTATERVRPRDTADHFSAAVDRADDPGAIKFSFLSARPFSRRIGRCSVSTITQQTVPKCIQKCWKSRILDVTD